MSTLCDADFFTWRHEQARALREAQAAHIDTPRSIDWENVAGEIESLGCEQANLLRSKYAVLLTHLLKWRYQPDLRSRGWELTIKRERREIPRHLDENPGLKSRDAQLFVEPYRYAREDAADEVDLPVETFPLACRYTVQQARDPEFWPDRA